MKAEINIFLDDERILEDAFHYTSDTDFLKKQWVIVRNFKEFCEVVENNSNNLGIISFDHDLADEHYDYDFAKNSYSDISEKTGYHCAKWLVDFCMDNKIKLPEYKVHSMNQVGKKNIISYLENFKKFQNEH